MLQKSIDDAVGNCDGAHTKLQSTTMTHIEYVWTDNIEVSMRVEL